MNSTVDQATDNAAVTDEQLALIAIFQELLAGDDAGITLTNIYKEMPITHPATLCEVKGRHVELETCELQLAAILQCNEVYIQSPLMEKPVLGRVESVDVRRSTVRLADFQQQELYVNRRSAVRVRFKRPISIVAYAGANKISGVIHDISLEGCCLNTLVRHGFSGDEELRVEIKLIAPSSGEELAMQIPATLVRVSEEGPPYKCILCFNHTQQSEHLLSVYINQRQHEILKELRESF